MLHVVEDELELLSFGLYLPNAGITGMCHHTRVPSFLFVLTKGLSLMALPFYYKRLTNLQRNPWSLRQSRVVAAP